MDQSEEVEKREMNQLNKNNIISHIDYALVPEVHPPMYLMHRWWARKPHNVVRQYVEHYSAQGEIVLDPFCGSGVTCAEALRMGRKTIGVDIAPVASFMTRMTVLPHDFGAFQKAYTDVEKHVREKINELYQTDCPSCRSPSTV